MPRSVAPTSVVRRLRELTVVSVAALAALGALTSASEVHARAVYAADRDRLVLAEQGLDQVARGMVDQETGVQGYLTSGDALFFERYESGQIEVLKGMGQLVAGLRDDECLALFAELQSRAGAWQQRYGAPTVALAGTDTAAAADAVRSEQGKELLDAFRMTAVRLDTHLTQEVEQLQAERDRVRVGLLAAALGLLALLAVGGGRRVRTTRALVERPVQVLANRAVAAAEGRPLPEPEAVPLELVPVREAVDTLVGDLAAARAQVAEQARQLSRATQVTGVLLEQTRLLAATSEPPAIAAATGESALQLLDGVRVAVWLDGPTGTRLAYTSGGRAAQEVPAVLGAGGGSGAAERALHFGRVVVDEGLDELRVAAPMVSEGRALGVVEVVLPGAGRPGGRDLDALQVLLGQGAGALTAARLLARTSELARRDPLTGLPNRRQLEQDLAELETAGTDELGLLVLDVDHFKLFNDTHGHAAGDDLLRALGDVLSSVVRQADGRDTVYRYGGEEFVVLLRRCPSRAVLPSAERLRETVARRLVAHAVTISVGAAGSGTTPTRDLFVTADKALYAAKAAGRNRVAVAEPPLREVPLVPAA